MHGGHESAPDDYLSQLAQLGDGPHDLATAGLMFAALDQPSRTLTPFKAHLCEMAEIARANLEFASDADAAAAALSELMVGRYGYEGDRMNYRDPQNADLMAVIERRRGLPVALGILYLHAARAGGLRCTGLLSPGHFLIAIGVRESETIIDPFNGGSLLDRERLGSPQMGMPPAGETGSLDPIGDIDVLLRLQNNMKLRAQEAGDEVRAAEIIRRMLLVAPRRASLWLECARLAEGAGALSSARRAFENALAFGQMGSGIYNEAQLALQSLKRRLN